MSLQQINLGNYANDGTGDDLRTAFEKVNANFTQLGATVSIANGANVGLGTGIFAQRNLTTLEFKTFTSADNSVEFTSNTTNVNLKANTILANDNSPELSADLSLNGNSIKAINGGDIQAPIYGIDIKIINSLMSILIETNQVSVDFGTYLRPTGVASGAYGYNVDMGSFLNPALENDLDFGRF